MLNRRVDEKEATRRAQKQRLLDLQQRIEAVIEQDLRSPKQQKRLANEVAFEEKKQSVAFVNETKAKPKAAGAKKSTPPEQKEGSELVVSVTTILLVFRRAAAVAGKKTQQLKSFAMTLWEDGPNVTPTAQFGRGSFIMKEYNVAFVRGEMDCGCTYCTNSAKLTMAEHDVHVAWHNKYRRFFALRAQKYPTLKDMGVLNTNLENAMLANLVELWRQVDVDAAWFHSAKYLANQEEIAATAKNAAKKVAALALANSLGTSSV